MYNTMITLAVLLDAYLWLAVVDKIWCRLSERSERKYIERREAGRRKAYADVYRRRCQKENRDELWRRYSK